MKAPQASDILARAKELGHYAAESLSKLIQIRSLSGMEKDIVFHLKEEFARCGADAVEIDRFGNVIARIGSGKPVIAIDAHIDTVDTGDLSQWNFEPFAGIIRENKVWGRGASDQKGGMASMLTAMRVLASRKDLLPATVFMIGSVLEEDCDGLCWRFLIEKTEFQPDFVILTEPTDGNINRGQRGRMEIEIIARGVSCHGSAPERGDNAIYKIAPIIEDLRRLNDDLPSDPFLGKGTLALSRVRSSSPSLCAVADLAAVYIDRRLTYGETADSAIQIIKELSSVKNMAAEVVVPEFSSPSWNGYVLPVPKIYPPWITQEDEPLLVNAIKCYEQLFARKPHLSKWTFSTNGVTTMGIHRIPTIGFGPGKESRAHAPNEHVEIEDLVNAAAFYSWLPWAVAGK